MQTNGKSYCDVCLDGRGCHVVARVQVATRRGRQAVCMRHLSAVLEHYMAGRIANLSLSVTEPLGWTELATVYDECSRLGIKVGA